MSRFSTRSLRRVVLATVAFMLMASACAEAPTADSPKASPSDRELLATSTTEPQAGSTSTTGTPPSTLVSTAPPRPSLEPDIEFLPPGDGVYTLDEIGSFYSFHDISGYRSYTATLTNDMTVDGVLTTVTSVLRVDEGRIAYGREDPGGASYEEAFSQDGEYWFKVDGEWVASTYGSDVGFQSLVTPDFQYSWNYEAFEFLEFLDWELIEGTWYARYRLTPEYVPQDSDDDDVTVVRGDFWFSELGFLHSYALLLADTRSDATVERAWSLSALGLTAIDLPDWEASMVQVRADQDFADLLGADDWDSLLFGYEPLRWRGSSSTRWDDLNPDDNFEYSSSGSGEHWGFTSTESQEAHSWQRGTDSDRAVEWVQVGTTMSRRYGTSTGEGDFNADPDPWEQYSVAEPNADPTSILLREGRWLFSELGLERLERLPDAIVDGLDIARYEAIIDHDEPGRTVVADFQFWVDMSGDTPRLVQLFYNAAITSDEVVNGDVTGVRYRVFELDVYDIGRPVPSIALP